MKEKHKQIYDFIVNYIQSHGYAPDLTDIGEGVGLQSKSAVSANLQQMNKLGIIEVVLGRSRCIKVPGYKFVREDEVCEVQKAI